MQLLPFADVRFLPKRHCRGRSQGHERTAAATATCLASPHRTPCANDRLSSRASATAAEKDAAAVVIEVLGFFWIMVVVMSKKSGVTGCFMVGCDLRITSLDKLKNNDYFIWIIY